jgi:FkbM family methyltransferase
MKRNRFVQQLARLTPVRRGYWSRLLEPGVEIHPALFGKYRFEMDLSLGFLQKVYFLKPTDYEPETMAAIRTWVKPGMTVLDIGAHTGFVTLYLADQVGETGHVLGFEPSPDNFRLLEKNVRSNSLPQVRLFPLALSDRSGTAALTRNPINDGGHSIGNQHQNPDMAGWDLEELKIQVPTRSLDDWLAEQDVDHVDFIKIDVEGAEGLVFAGARELLSSPRAPFIICEVADAAQRSVGQTEASLRQILYDYDYRSYWLRKGCPELRRKDSVKGLHNLLFRKS